MTDKINNLIGIHLGQFLTEECGPWVERLWQNGTLAYATSFRVDTRTGRQTADVNYQQPIDYLLTIVGRVPQFDELEQGTLDRSGVRFEEID
ncbi:hypothetical protein [Dyella subtropica]|uniref:hypothetical protein n=1 Tax=Dyella subtropica TaxID=2992127 RepID=UPI002259AFED|nr:hypothetical protein [Dyella subtropica]